MVAPSTNGVPVEKLKALAGGAAGGGGGAAGGATYSSSEPSSSMSIVGASAPSATAERATCGARLWSSNEISMAAATLIYPATVGALAPAQFPLAPPQFLRCTTARFATRHRIFASASPLDDDEDGEYTFWDRTELFVRSGAGGDGAVAFVGRRPAGGSGGAGGSVVLEATDDVNTLAHLQHTQSIHADRGDDASGRASGRDAADAVIRVPPNVEVWARPAGGDAPERVGELGAAGERLRVAEGGAGGLGNGEVWKRSRLDPKRREPPGGTARQQLLLSMTLVADVGLLGYPNAGKSTLLRAVTAAQPKVADYPFTTVIPNLGVCAPRAFGGDGPPMKWLDIPGLLEGASAGRGLGRAFLRHTASCRLLLHLIDGASDDPAADFTKINEELRLFDAELARKPQVVLLTKADLPEVEPEVEARLESLRAVVPHGRLLVISAESGLGLPALVRRTRGLLDQLQDR